MQDSEHESPALHLINLRWPGGLRCATCDVPVPVPPAAVRLRCTRCGRDFSLFAGTSCEGTKLPPSTWTKAAEVFSGSREGVSVRQMAARVGVTVESAQRVLTTFRDVIKARWLSDNPRPAKILLVELVVGPRLFCLHPPEHVEGRFRLLLACGVETGAAGLLAKLTSFRVIRLGDASPTTLASVAKKEIGTASVVFVFEGSRCIGTATLSLEEFLKNVDRAGGQFSERLAELRALLVSGPHGKGGTEQIDRLLAEYHFRQSLRVQHTRYIADRLLELLLAPLPQSYHRT